MNRQTRKYIYTAVVLLLCGPMVFGFSRAGDEYRERMSRSNQSDSLISILTDSVLSLPALPKFEVPADTVFNLPDSILSGITDPSSRILNRRRLPVVTINDSTGMPVMDFRGVFGPPAGIVDLRGGPAGVDSLAADTLPRVKQSKPFLDEPIFSTNRDSLVYDVKNKMVYIYQEGDVIYEDMNLKADFIEVDMSTKLIYAYGISDTLGNKTRPEFYERGQLYTMDTINYNIDTKKAKIKGISTQEGDGFLIGEEVKKMPDNTTNIAHGKYTTCDHLDHPHFYLAMKKAKVIPGKKVVVGPSHFVMEDVPIRFPLLPFGFFPITSGRSSGFIVPTFGEEYVKGFFLRDGGYYFAFNDYIDLTLTAGIYTLGSWDGNVSSRYVKRYRFSGALNARYSKVITGEKNSADYVNQSNFSLQWTHQQDPKFKPNSTFSASVNFSTSGYNKYSSTTMNDYLNTQTNSSVSYSKSWPGKPFSLSTSFSHSQNSRDSTVSLTFPNVSFNVSKVYPFKRKEAVGKARWYEKISFNYSAAMQNSVTTKEKDLFTQTMFDNMRMGVNHTIPISASWNLFNYINFGPTFNYNERWYFKRYTADWDAEEQRIVYSDADYGFYRVYDYRFSVSANTKIYGMFLFKENFPVQAIRHVMTPTVSFSFAPDFSQDKYGYYQNVQRDVNGNIQAVNRYQNGVLSPLYGVPGNGRSAMINFSLGNNVEAKIKSDKDTTGTRKIPILDNLSISSSYNFLADSLNLAPFSVNLKTTIRGSYALNLSMTLDPYQVDETGRKINRFMVKQGKLVRLTSASTSFGYTFNSTTSNRPAMNDINSGMGEQPENGFFNDPHFYDMDPARRRELMSSQYYDFNIPWNFGFNYSFSYTSNGITKNINQTLSFQASVTLTEKWGLTFSGFGYDFKMKTLTPGQVYITRDLHCWQMNLSWVPIGFRKSWSFNISVKSPVLRDLKYDKSSSFYDNLYD